MMRATLPFLLALLFGSAVAHLPCMMCKSIVFAVHQQIRQLPIELLDDQRFAGEEQCLQITDTHLLQRCRHANTEMFDIVHDAIHTKHIDVDWICEDLMGCSTFTVSEMNTCMSCANTLNKVQSNVFGTICTTGSGELQQLACELQSS